MTWTPGLSFDDVIQAAPIAYIRAHLGSQVCTLLDMLSGGTASDDRLRGVASKAIDVERLLTDEHDRSELLALLSEAKQTELARRLSEASLDAAPPALAQLTWTPAQRAELLEFLGLAPDRPAALSPSSLRTVDPDYGLFVHQRHAAARVIELLYSGPRRVVLHLPTGVGKTRTAMSIICDHLRGHDPTLVVWLAHGSELLEQAAEEFERAWSKLGDRSLPVLRLWGASRHDVSTMTDGLVVVGLEKATSLSKRDPQFLHHLARRATLTVFDEAHQIVAPTYQSVVDAVTVHPDASLLGLTATPGRTWADIVEDERLSDFFDRRKVVLTVDGYNNPVTALIEGGYLARPFFRTVASEAGMKLSQRDRVALSRSFDLPVEVLERLAQDEAWNLQVINTIVSLLDAGHLRILVFATSVEHCRLIAAVLSALGVEADFVTGSSSPGRRADAIGRFRRKAKRPMVLCNYGVLTTGFDAPAASAAVIARPTRSLVLYSQMVGRVIRGPKAGGTATCEIVTVVDPQLSGFGDVAEAFTNWEDVWEQA